MYAFEPQVIEIISNDKSTLSKLRKILPAQKHVLDLFIVKRENNKFAILIVDPKENQIELKIDRLENLHGQPKSPCDSFLEHLFVKNKKPQKAEKDKIDFFYKDPPKDWSTVELPLS